MPSASFSSLVRARRPSRMNSLIISRVSFSSRPYCVVLFINGRTEIFFICCGNICGAGLYGEEQPARRKTAADTAQTTLRTFKNISPPNRLLIGQHVYYFTG